jgi:phosphoserine phosphatase
MPDGPNKGTAIEMIADMSGIELENSLAAGNDHNDMPMLGHARLGLPVPVGLDMTPEMLSQLPERSIYVPNPRKLGTIISREVTL